MLRRGAGAGCSAGMCRPCWVGGVSGRSSRPLALKRPDRVISSIPVHSNPLPPAMLSRHARSLARTPLRHALPCIALPLNPSRRWYTQPGLKPDPFRQVRPQTFSPGPQLTPDPSLQSSYPQRPRKPLHGSKRPARNSGNPPTRSRTRSPPPGSSPVPSWRTVSSTGNSNGPPGSSWRVGSVIGCALTLTHTSGTVADSSVRSSMGTLPGGSTCVPCLERFWTRRRIRR